MNSLRITLQTNQTKNSQNNVNKVEHPRAFQDEIIW